MVFVYSPSSLKGGQNPPKVLQGAFKGVSDFLKFHKMRNISNPPCEAGACFF